ncbi:MAG: hypothetical protein AB8I08_09975 [Sandaracinaceae bacterium]
MNGDITLRFAASLGAIFLCCGTSLAHAQSEPVEATPAEASGDPAAEDAPAPAAEARALIERGLAHRERQEDREALAAFRAAFDLGGSREARAQMALAEQALGDWLAAEADLAASLVGPDAWIDPRRAVLEQELEGIRARLGRLEVLGGEPGAELELDGRSLGTLPQASPAFVLPGRARLSVMLDGYDPVVRTVEVQLGQLTRETIVMVPEAEPESVSQPISQPPSQPISAPLPDPPPSPSPPPLTADGGPFVALGIASLVVGGLALGAGVGMLVWREDRAGVWNDDVCLGTDPTRTRMENCGSVLDDIRLAEALGGTGLALGGALLGLGIVFLLMDDSPSDRTSIGCGAGPGELGVSCGGVF